MDLRILLDIFLEFLIFLVLFLKVLMLLLTVTTEHQKWPKINTNSVKSTFLPKGQKSVGRRLKPSAGPRSKPTQLAVPSSFLKILK